MKDLLVNRDTGRFDRHVAVSGKNGKVQPMMGNCDPCVMPYRRRGWGLIASALLLVFLCFCFAGSFVFFANKVGRISMPDDPRADAIVVLTGGKERVKQAVALLAEGRAKRLLISGVHPGSTAQQIASVTAGAIGLFDCCIDLDRQALNTAGNAAETASWVRSHGFGSLLLVTSAYHLPRAKLELAKAMPEVTLYAYPVYQPELDLKAWYRKPGTIVLLMREYVKYTVAHLRISAARLAAHF